MKRYGLAAVLVLAAAVWPSLSDALIVGAGILLALSFAVRRHPRNADKRTSHRRLRAEGVKTSHSSSTRSPIEAHLPLRYAVWRNELTGELLERSRRRARVPVVAKRRHRSATARTLLARSLGPTVSGSR